MSKTVVTEEFDDEGNLVKRITTTTETGDAYTPYYPYSWPYGNGHWYNDGKIIVTS